MVTSKTLPSITSVKKIRTHRSAHSKVILSAQRGEKKVYKEKGREIFSILFYMQQAQPKAKNKKIKDTWG